MMLIASVELKENKTGKCKAIVHPKIKILSSFTLMAFLLYDFLLWTAELKSYRATLYNGSLVHIVNYLS